MDHQLSLSNYTECYVFIDDSNLWIEGQKVQGKLLRDADIDPRFRVDLGRFIKMVTSQRSIAKAFLYGSIPPPNDSVWEAAKKKNFVVKIFQRSYKGKEKEVDVTMSSDITEQVMELKFGNQDISDPVFVIVTGDRDLRTPISKALMLKYSVELWSWEQSLSREFRLMANTEECLTVRILDDVIKSFAYFAFKSTRVSGDIDPAHAIVFPSLPGSTKFFYSFANELTRLLHLFYITSVESHTKGMGDLIVEFPNSHPEAMLSLLRKCKFPYGMCNYPEYVTKRSYQMPPTKTVNRFEALVSLDDCDDETLTEAVESSMSVEVDEIVPSSSTEPELDGGSEETDDWLTYVRKRRKAGRMTRVHRRRDTPCRWGIHCVNSLNCSYSHTDEEKKLFRVNPNIKFQYWKASLCNKLSQHTQPEQQRRCSFAHGNDDAWCLKCKSYGHFTNDCAV